MRFEAWGEKWAGTHFARPFEMFLNIQKVYSPCGGSSEEDIFLYVDRATGHPLTKKFAQNGYRKNTL